MLNHLFFLLDLEIVCLIFYDIIKYSSPDSSFSVPLAHPSIFVSI